MSRLVVNSHWFAEQVTDAVAAYGASPPPTVLRETVLLETVVLSILNHDSAIASAASRMTTAADGRPCIEMGSRRTHEEAEAAAPGAPVRMVRVRVNRSGVPPRGEY